MDTPTNTAPSVRDGEEVGRASPGGYGISPGAIARAMDEDGGWWSSCSGCLETVDGHASSGYPWSEVFRCHVGAGCTDCGGLGVTWSYYTEEQYAEMGREAAAPVSSSGDGDGGELERLSREATPGVWCGLLRVEATREDSDYCDALVNAHRSGKLVLASGSGEEKISGEPSGTGYSSETTPS